MPSPKTMVPVPVKIICVLPLPLIGCASPPVTSFEIYKYIPTIVMMIPQTSIPYNGNGLTLKSFLV